MVNQRTGERRSMKDPRVTLVWPSMGQETSAIVARVAQSHGVNSVALPAADIETAPRARAVASGKECIPALLVLGAVLDYLAKAPPDPDHVHLIFMPITTGPCRTGQYAIFYQALFQELGLKNVVMLSLNSDNSYSELGNNFNRDLWKMVSVGDYFRDIVGVAARARGGPRRRPRGGRRGAAGDLRGGRGRGRAGPRRACQRGRRRLGGHPAQEAARRGEEGARRRRDLRPARRLLGGHARREARRRRASSPRSPASPSGSTTSTGTSRAASARPSR